MSVSFSTNTENNEQNKDETKLGNNYILTPNLLHLNKRIMKNVKKISKHRKISGSEKNYSHESHGSDDDEIIEEEIEEEIDEIDKSLESVDLNDEIDKDEEVEETDYESDDFEDLDTTTETKEVDEESSFIMNNEKDSMDIRFNFGSSTIKTRFNYYKELLSNNTDFGNINILNL